MDITLMVIGIIVALVSALADVVGYGDGVAFGIYQLSGSVAGLLVALVGGLMKWGEKLHIPMHPKTRSV
jgi:hypothetical protein